MDLNAVYARFTKKHARGDGCWAWRASRNRYGYGRMALPGFELAHRVSWHLHVGPIPTGYCVLHRCDNRWCVRPGHLFLGTHKDNMADMIRKGRHNSPRHRTEVTAKCVAALRERYESGDTQLALAQEYGINRTTVGRIVRRVTWRG